MPIRITLLYAQETTFYFFLWQLTLNHIHSCYFPKLFAYRHGCLVHITSVHQAVQRR